MEMCVREDIDARKAAIYRANFGAEHLIVDDVFKLSIAAVPPTADLWTASFPCTDLSLAGNRTGLSTGQSKAFWGFIRLLSSARRIGRPPSFILIENVIGFAHSRRGKDLILQPQLTEGRG